MPAHSGVRTWLLGLVLGAIVMVILGGVTRLTLSGLSITEWNPIFGFVPPLSDADWSAELEKYRQTPQARTVFPDISLSDFKKIYFWEFVHRLWGRVLGIVFAVPLIWFWKRRMLDGFVKRRLALALAMGGLQAWIGWFMVKSGLTEGPFVSPLRLAIHFSLAVVLIVLLFDTALRLKADEKQPVQRTPLRTPLLCRWFFPITALGLGIQIVFGALNAGHKTGTLAPTFPTMNGYWIPPGLWELQPVLINFLSNPVTVQWFHRLLGTLIVAAFAFFGVKLWRAGRKRSALFLSGLVLFQFVLGAVIVVTGVPILLAVLHQLSAVIIVLAFVWMWSDGDLPGDMR